MIADLDTLLIALHVELTDRITPSRNVRRGPGRPPVVTDAELVCLAVAQVLLRYDDERHWLRAAASRVAHMFPRLVCQSEYNLRLRQTADLMDGALRWLATACPSTAERIRLMDGTPVRCAAPRETAKRSELAGWAGYGHDTSHHCFYCGSKLLLLTAPDGMVTGFGLANPKLYGEREAVLLMLAHPNNQPEPGTIDVCDKGFAGHDFEHALHERYGITVMRPARKDEPDHGFPNWLRQRIESVNWTLKGQLGLDRHGARIPSGLWARVNLRPIPRSTI